MRAVLALLLCFVCSQLASCSTPSSSQDQAILAGARRYLDANSAPTVGETTLKIEEVAGDYARVSVTPVKPTADPAVIYLRRDPAQAWQGITLGTGWSPEDFDQFHIPQNIRD